MKNVGCNYKNEQRIKLFIIFYIFNFPLQILNEIRKCT